MCSIAQSCREASWPSCVRLKPGPHKGFSWCEGRIWNPDLLSCCRVRGDHSPGQGHVPQKGVGADLAISVGFPSPGGSERPPPPRLSPPTRGCAPSQVSWGILIWVSRAIQTSFINGIWIPKPLSGTEDNSSKLHCLCLFFLLGEKFCKRKLKPEFGSTVTWARIHIQLKIRILQISLQPVRILR